MPRVSGDSGAPSRSFLSPSTALAMIPVQRTVEFANTASPLAELLRERIERSAALMKRLRLTHAA